jgi:hypothetical protein
LRAELGSYPDPWDAHVFNKILVLSYLDDGEPEIPVGGWRESWRRSSPTDGVSASSTLSTTSWGEVAQRLTPPHSPQRAIGYATPTSSADRPLLHPRRKAYKRPRL